jgi:hypothetical protein
MSVRSSGGLLRRLSVGSPARVGKSHASNLLCLMHLEVSKWLDGEILKD